MDDTGCQEAMTHPYVRYLSCVRHTIVHEPAPDFLVNKVNVNRELPGIRYPISLPESADHMQPRLITCGESFEMRCMCLNISRKLHERTLTPREQRRPDQASAIGNWKPESHPAAMMKIIGVEAIGDCAGTRGS